MPKPTTTATVNLNEKDPSKAVSRFGNDDNDDASDPERRHSDWLDKNRAVQKRFARFGDKLTRQFDQKLAEQQADFQRQLRERDDELERLRASREEASAGTDQAAHDAEMAELERKIAAAHEAGESTEVARLTALMSRKSAEFMHKKTQAALKAPGRDRQQGNGSQQQSARPNKAAQFIAKNKHWWDKNVAAKGYANELYRQALDSGKDVESDSLFEKIGKKLIKQFPDLELRNLHDDDDDFEDDDELEGGFDDADDDDEDDAPAPRRAAVQSFQRRTVSSRRRGTSIDADDQAAMREFGLDPTNDKHVLQWAREKQNTADEDRA